MIQDDVIRQLCIACLLPSYQDTVKLNDFLINTVFVNNPQKIVSLNYYFDFTKHALSENFISADVETKRKFLKNLYYYTYEHMIKKISKITLASDYVSEQIHNMLTEFGIQSSFYKNRLTLNYDDKKAVSRIIYEI